MKPSRDIARLIEIMAALRTPGSGCPWDLEQNFESIAPYTIEEAYEVADAIGRGDLSGVLPGLPALARALKLQQKASKVGFDWNDVQAVIGKIREETDEIAWELDAGERDKVAGEIGDLLFVVVNLARHLDVDPETALRMTNLKVERRFAAIEDGLAEQGKTPVDATLGEMDA